MEIKPMEDRQAFAAARDQVVGVQRKRQGIGTLSEKTVHAILKNYYAPSQQQEIPVDRYVADICTGSQIIEIQTRNFNVMRDKLQCFLQLYPVTIVYPVPNKKWIIWIDEESGELSEPRKSPVTGNVYSVFRELYRIKGFLKNPNLHFKVVLLDMEEYRLLNGWSRDKKRGSARYDRIPTELVKEISIDCLQDYLQFLPFDLPEQFTSAEFARAVHITKPLAQVSLNLFHYVGVVERVGKKGNSFLYTVKDF